MEKIYKGKGCILRVQIEDVANISNANYIDTHIVNPSGVAECVECAYDELEGVVIVDVCGKKMEDIGEYRADIVIGFGNTRFIVPEFAFAEVAEVAEDAEECEPRKIVEIMIRGGEPSTDESVEVELATRGEIANLEEEIAQIRKDIEQMVCVTYAELREMKAVGSLQKGTYYRITDFVTATSQSNTKSAGHPFDIIVMALDAHTLSEEALAMHHEGDTYFAKCNLAAWRLMYNFDNDTNRYGWSKKWVEEAPQKWSCQWGLLEEKLNNDASTNYTTAVVDGETKYLYKPASPTNFLEGKSFYERVVTGSITSYEGLIFEADDAPYNEGDDEDPMWYWEDIGDIRVKTADGTQIATLQNDGGSFVDTRDSDYMYYIEFSPDAVEVDEGVYHFTPTYGIEDWWENVQGGSVNTYETIPYTGSNDVLLYAFDSVLPKSSKAVTEVYSPITNKVYLYEGGQLDTITYTKYTAAVEGHKGVIYRIVDEYGNEARYDFKNIQHKVNSEWFYTFGATDKSLNGTSFDNVIDVSNAKKLPVVVIKGTASLNEIRIVISGKLIANDIKGTRISESYNVTSITFGENVYSCLITGLKGTLTAEDRLNTVVISQCNGLSLKGEYYYSKFEGTGSFSVIDKNGNSKMMRGVSVVLGNSADGSKSNVTLVDNTTSSANTVTDSFIVYAPNWGSETIDISNSFSTSAPKRVVKIAKNSAGVVKIWCEADLV